MWTRRFPTLTLSGWLNVQELPWFVSDTSTADFEWMVDRLAQSDTSAVATLGAAFQKHLESGAWVLKSHPFWTLPHEFSQIGTLAPDLRADLGTADLVFLKGDLNYRKLLADRSWDPTTPFDEVTRAFCDTTFCSLRTLKANLVCGLDPGVAERVSAVQEDWMVAGIYGVIQSVITP